MRTSGTTNGMTLALLALIFAGCLHDTPAKADDRAGAPPSPTLAPPKGAPAMTNKSYPRPADEALRSRLTPLEWEVTQNDATEPPFRNRFWNNHEDGLYVDIVSGEPLFSSRDKFESGTGWPSFTRPVEDGRVNSKTDVAYGMRRVEVRSASGNAHLGHVFEDGPAPTGMRYCINSASLRFIPKAELVKEGYGAFAARFDLPAGKEIEGGPNSCTTPPPGEAPGCEATLETAIIAGGCFWGMEDLLRKIPGVLETEVGYTGGTVDNPVYEDVHTGRSGHAEAVRIVFDPKKLAYEDLLEKWFFRMHDPTTADRQGNDIGSQYRSAIFFGSDAQRKSAEAVIARVNQAGKWRRPVVTRLEPAGKFYPAEGYHQDYLVKHPDGYTCHFLRD